MSFKPSRVGYRVGSIYLLDDGRKVYLKHEFSDRINDILTWRYLVTPTIELEGRLIAIGASFIVEKLNRQ